MMRSNQLLGWTLGLCLLFLATLGLRVPVAAADLGPLGLLWWPTGGVVAAMFACSSGIVALSLAADFTIHLSCVGVVQQAALNTCMDALPAMLMAYGMRKLELRASLTRLYDVAVLAGVGAAGTGLVAAGLSWLYFAWVLGEPTLQGPRTLASVALAHGASVLLVAPAVLVWWPRRRQGPRSWPQMAEVLALTATLLFVALHLAPLQQQSPLADAPPAVFVFLPAFLWAATRFGQRGAVSALAFVGAATLALRAVLTLPSPIHSLLVNLELHAPVSMQLYLCLALLCVLIFGSVIEERREAIRLRDDFLLIASHELKTPLTALMLGVENLERRMQRESNESAQAYRRKLGTCHAQIDRLARLVDGLLDVSRISGRNLRLRRQYQNLTGTVTTAVQNMKTMVEQTHCRIDCELQDDAWGFYDEHRVLQLLQVLLENACKYGAGKPVLVQLSCKAAQVRIVVQDQGIGVPPEDAKRIFRRFERAVSTHSYGGLGLGLFVAHKIAAAHGGELKVDVACSSGARFVAQLPRRDTRFARWLYARSELPSWLRPQSDAP